MPRALSAHELRSPVPTDAAVARSCPLLPVATVAAELGLAPADFDTHGPSVAKLRLGLLDSLADREDGYYVVVGGITPTPLGEGKSTTTAGLSQVVPMEAFNLHLTGDIHAVTAANNLLAAAVDARMLHEATQSDEALFRRLCPPGSTFSPVMRRRLARLGLPPDVEPDDLTPAQASAFARLDLDPTSVTWRRCVDTNDRMLRSVRVGAGPNEAGRLAPRDTGFDISVASEVMAVLAMASCAADLRERLGALVVGSDRAGAPVTADDIGCSGALAVLMRDALRPTLLQTLEGTPALVHAGPFANIAVGNSSALACRTALKLAGPGGFVVTEAGFGADIGVEKFVNLKCRAAGLQPHACVLVATVRALKMHGGGPPVAAGTPLDPAYRGEDVAMVAAGCANLVRHIENVRAWGLACVVAINRFATDTDAELAAVRSAALAAGAADAVVAEHHALGGRGAVALARAVAAACDAAGSPPPPLCFTYLLSDPAAAKIERLARGVFRAEGVDFAPAALAQLGALERHGFGLLPVCVAKTQYSFSADPAAKGAPAGFRLPVRGVRLAAGAGWLIVLVGDMPSIPGLPTRPCYYDIDLLPDGTVVGLS